MLLATDYALRLYRNISFIGMLSKEKCNQLITLITNQRSSDGTPTRGLARGCVCGVQQR